MHGNEKGAILVDTLYWIVVVASSRVSFSIPGPRVNVLAELRRCGGDGPGPQPRIGWVVQMRCESGSMFVARLFGSREKLKIK